MSFSDDPNTRPQQSPLSPLKDRLRDCWVNGKYADFYAAVMAELEPKVLRYFKGHDPYRQLSEEDQEDCFSQALEGLIELQRIGHCTTTNFESYIWQSAKNAAFDLIKSRIRMRKALGEAVEELEEEDITGGDWTEQDDQPNECVSEPGPDEVHHLAEMPEATETIGNEPSPLEGANLPGEDDEDPGAVEALTYPSAKVLIEGLYEDIEAEEQWAVEVIRTSIKRLRPAERRVIEAVLQYGPDYNSADAPADLGLTPVTFRAHKSKAYKNLREIIPKTIEELGVKPMRLEIYEAIFHAREPVPSEDKPEDTAGH